MIEGDPNWKVFVNLLGALYEHHPIRTSVAKLCGVHLPHHRGDPVRLPQGVL